MDAILTNPRYTGRQVWNRQRKREVLLDVEDVALGHVTKMSWNPAGEWVYSEQVADHRRRDLQPGAAAAQGARPGTV